MLVDMGDIYPRRPTGGEENAPQNLAGLPSTVTRVHAKEEDVMVDMEQIYET